MPATSGKTTRLYRFDNMFGGCAIAVSTMDAMYLTNPFDELLRFKTFETDPGLLDP